MKNVTTRLNMPSHYSYLSPDKMLTLEVEELDGDFMIGFKGGLWHTHGDLLVSSYGTNEQESVSNFVSAILGNKLVIAVSKSKSGISDIAITETPESEYKYLEAGDELELRYWDGRSWSPTNG